MINILEQFFWIKKFTIETRKHILENFKHSWNGLLLEIHFHLAKRRRKNVLLVQPQTHYGKVDMWSWKCLRCTVLEHKRCKLLSVLSWMCWWRYKVKLVKASWKRMEVSNHTGVLLTSIKKSNRSYQMICLTL